MRRQAQILVLCLALALIGAGRAAQAACQLALALALDVSTSVDASDYALQRDGLAGALGSPTVRAALFSGADHVAISVYEWSGRLQQKVVLDWLLLETPAHLDAAIARIRAAQRSFDTFPTAMGHALDFGRRHFANAPTCARRTIDVSGDGVTNEGFDPPAAYRRFDFADITVNGLVIRTGDHRVPIYYTREVIRGPDAFVEIAEGFEDFERAMRIKLIREIGVLAIGAIDPLPPQSGG